MCEFALSIPGMPVYSARSCCRKGPGRACRCGTFVGWKADCRTPCSIAMPELLASAPLALPPTKIRGRLVHVTEHTPLHEEAVSMTLPGGEVVSTRSEIDGTFKLEFGNERNGAPFEVSLGDLVSVSASDRAADEEPVYRLFLTE